MTGVDEAGGLKFSQTNPEFSVQQQQPAMGLIRVPFRNMGTAQNKPSLCAW